MPAKMRLEIATQEHECYGCAGEMKIHKGDSILVNADEPTAPPFCIRCALAIAAKNKFRKEPSLLIKYGELQLFKLSNAFRKRWIKFVQDVQRTNGDCEKRKILIKELQEEFGFAVENVKKEKTLEEKLNDKINTQKKLCANLKKALKKLTTAQFRVKVVANDVNHTHEQLDDASQKCVQIKNEIEEIVNKMQKSLIE